MTYCPWTGVLLVHALLPSSDRPVLSMTRERRMYTTRNKSRRRRSLRTIVRGRRFSRRKRTRRRKMSPRSEDEHEEDVEETQV